MIGTRNGGHRRREINRNPKTLNPFWPISGVGDTACQESEDIRMMAMKEKVQNFGPKEIEEKVRVPACAPSVEPASTFALHRELPDNTLVMDSCSRHEGRYYAFCPRTPTDIENLRQSLFDPLDFTPEVGCLKGFHITRAETQGPRIRPAWRNS